MDIDDGSNTNTLKASTAGNEYFSCQKFTALLLASIFGSIAIMGVSAGYIYDATTLKSENVHTVVLMKLCDSIGYITHVIQAERGATSLLISSGFQSLSMDDLNRARTATDDTIRLKSSEFVPARAGLNYTEQSLITDLKTVRDKVMEVSRSAAGSAGTAQQYIQSYNKITSELSSIVGYAITHLGQLTHWQRLMAYYIFTSGKDNEGQERASGSSIISTSKSVLSVKELNFYARVSSASVLSYEAAKSIEDSIGVIFKRIEVKKAFTSVSMYRDSIMQLFHAQNTVAFTNDDPTRFFNNMTSLLTDRLAAYNQLLDRIHVGLALEAGALNDKVTTYIGVLVVGVVWLIVQVICVIFSVSEYGSYEIQQTKASETDPEAKKKEKGGKKGRRPGPGKGGKRVSAKGT